MATHSSILAWTIPWTVEPGGLQSIGSQSQTWLKQLSTQHTHTHTCSSHKWKHTLLVLLCLDDFIQHYVFKIDPWDLIFPFYRYDYPPPPLYRGCGSGNQMRAPKMQSWNDVSFQLASFYNSQEKSALIHVPRPMRQLKTNFLCVVFPLRIFLLFFSFPTPPPSGIPLNISSPPSPSFFFFFFSPQSSLTPILLGPRGPCLEMLLLGFHLNALSLAWVSVYTSHPSAHPGAVMSLFPSKAISARRPADSVLMLFH